MLPKFTGSPHVYVTLVNGLHTESLSPPVARRYMEFLQLYVGKKVPDLTAGSSIAAGLGSAIWGVTKFAPFENRFAGQTYDQALKAFESEPPVRVLFEQGGNAGFSPSTPEPNFTAEFSAWPIPEAKAATWGLGTNGALVPSKAGAAGDGVDTYTADPTKLPATFYSGNGNGVWRADVKYDWQRLPDGFGVGYVTTPLEGDYVMAGSGSVDLWIKSSSADTDLQATLSEVRPDGKEIYVQSGWLRASQRALDEANSSELRPAHTNAKADAADLPKDEWSPVRIELFPFAHPFRKGSRLRLTINAPGNARAVWQFQTIDKGEQVQIAHDASHPSKLVLSVLPGTPVTAPAPPACGSLRGQPCRTYAAAANGG
jgi:predicted acyl esterase